MFLTLKFAARSPSPPYEEHGLLQVAVDELGAVMCGMLLFLISWLVTLLFLWLTLVWAGPLSFGGHSRAWHAGGS